jgi:predicted nucleic acid-binding protein
VILYLDTSALVKLYIDETGSSAVAAQVERAVAAATTPVAYVEARAAFARRRRERTLSPLELRRIVRDLDLDWGSYTLVEIGDRLVRHAGVLAERHALRAYDAVHLAAALDIRRAGGDVEFACFDAHLTRAARREGL